LTALAFGIAVYQYIRAVAAVLEGIRSQRQAVEERVWHQLTDNEQESIDRRAPANSAGSITPGSTDHCTYDADARSWPGRPHLEMAEEMRGCT